MKLLRSNRGFHRPGEFQELKKWLIYVERIFVSIDPIKHIHRLEQKTRENFILCNRSLGIYKNERKVMERSISKIFDFCFIRTYGLFIQLLQYFTIE